jgi:pimeloyl-ACP methyl ester carboxylesterase
MTMSTATGRYAPVNGLQLYYEQHGQGHPLVLLHGGLLTIDLSFGKLIPLLAPQHHVIAVDMQGHGRTGDVDREPSIPNLAADVVALLDHLGIQRADVLGFSLGAFVATELGIRHPDRVDRLVLASGRSRPEGYHDLSRAPGSARMPTAEEFAEMREEYRRMAPDPDHFDAFAEKMSAVVAAFDGWSDEALRGITAPVLLLIGDTDFTRIEHAAQMHELIPDAQLAVLPGARHTEVTHRVDVVAPMLEAFLSRSGGVNGSAPGTSATGPIRP